ncbi:MAG: hypothetical protein AAB782_00275 [Patescibacteria group bacterium]
MNRQELKLGGRILENLPVMTSNVMQDWIDNPKALGEFLSGLNPPEVVVPVPEPPLDFTIRVNRSVKPAYPDWVKEVMHPELECTGPANYNLQTAVEEWLHDDQQDGSVQGGVIYTHLKKDNALADCLGLADLLAIQTKGIAVFRKLFGDKAVFGWKSVVQDRDIDGYLCVPCLCGDGGGVVLSWRWLGSAWGSGGPALRFRK